MRLAVHFPALEDRSWIFVVAKHHEATIGFVLVCHEALITNVYIVFNHTYLCPWGYIKQKHVMITSSMTHACHHAILSIIESCSCYFASSYYESRSTAYYSTTSKLGIILLMKCSRNVSSQTGIILFCSLYILFLRASLCRRFSDHFSPCTATTHRETGPSSSQHALRIVGR